MKRQLTICMLAALLLALPMNVQAKLNVFACEPEWGALAKEIGDNKLNIIVATHAKQDPHYIRARPSLIAKIRRADMVICSGAGLEIGWLPLLLQKGSAKVQINSVGHLVASDYVPILEKPKVVDRSLGDVHPEGNPHIHLNPHNMLPVAKELAARLAKLDQANATFYHDRFNAFKKRWTKSIASWEKKVLALKEMHVVVHHRAFSYLIHWLNVKQVASLESKPGIPPTTAHLESVLQQLEKTPAHAIIRTPYEPGKASEWLSRKANIPAIILPYTTINKTKSKDLFALFNQTIDLLMGAMHVQP